ncbi:unnamed protein product, partial [Coregonus sp. 'balchen']
KDECQIGANKICGQHTAGHNTHVAGDSPSNNMAIFIPNDGTHCQGGYQVHNGAEPFHPHQDKALCKGKEHKPLVLSVVRLLTTIIPPSAENAVQLSATGSLVALRDSSGKAGRTPRFVWQKVCGSLVCEVKCGPAHALANSEEIWQNISVVFYRCLEGFHSWRGRKTSVCDITGTWQAATLQCREIKPAISDLVVLMKHFCVGKQTSMKKTQKITDFYQVPLEGTRVFDCSSPKNPDVSSQRKSHGQSITSQVQLRDVGKEITLTVTDGCCYCVFYNAPLQNGTSNIMQVSSLFAGGSIGVFALVICLGDCYTWFCKKT